MHKWNSHLALFVLVASLTVAGLAQSADGARKEDHEALRALRTQAADALNRRDMKALRACFAKEFVFTGVDQTVVTNEKELTAYEEAMVGGASPILKSITVNPSATILTHFLSDNVGYCYGVSDDTYTLTNGSVSRMPCQWTATLVKEEGQWKIAAAHAGANILKNPILSRVEAFGIRLGIGGLLVGLVVGFLVSFLVCRFKKG